MSSAERRTSAGPPAPEAQTVEPPRGAAPHTPPEASGAKGKTLNPSSSRIPHPSRPEVVIIAAVAEAPEASGADRLIGDGLELPWHLPVDFRRFKEITTGHPLIMGRKTFESLLHQNGGPLPNRENVVLTRHPTRVDHPGIHVYGSLRDALDGFSEAERVFIGGGAGVYGSVLEEGLADRLELTLVEGTFEGDTFFPPYRHLLEGNGGPYRLAERQRHAASGGRPAFRFDTYIRTRGAEQE